jgi:hypothetical protein
MQKGFVRPGYFFIDGKGIIREKFFDARYRSRLTRNSLFAAGCACLRTRHKRA